MINDTSVKHTNKDALLFNTTAESDFKRLYGVSTLCYYVRSAPSHRNPYSHFPAMESVTKVRNSIKINHLPLMIFIWWPSQVSLLDMFVLFDNIPPLCPKTSVLLVRLVQKSKGTMYALNIKRKSQSTIKVRRNMSNYV